MPGFFEAMGAKSMMGRPITDDDTANTPNVAVVNEAFVKRFFKNQNPIGQHFGIDRIKYASTYEIVGVVKDIRYMTGDYKEPVGPMSWVSETQTVHYDDPAFPRARNGRTSSTTSSSGLPAIPPGMEQRVRKAIASVDPTLVLDTSTPTAKWSAPTFNSRT